MALKMARFLGQLGILALFFTAVICTVTDDDDSDDLESRWNRYKQRYGKQYSGAENLYRRKIWEKAVQEIEEHNRLYENGTKSFRLGETEFADMDDAEFAGKMLVPPNSYRPKKGATVTPFYYSAFMENNKAIPDEIDWRKAGFVSPVKHQGTCGSCFAFAAVGCLESHWRMYSGLASEVEELSVQELVDCTWQYDNNGCSGGWAYNAWQYIIDKGRISLASSYPYEDRNYTCRAPTTPQSFGASLIGYVQTQEHNLEEMRKAIALHGPVTTTIYVVRSFQLFNGSGDDLYDETNCPTDTNNHEMVAVGYGTTKDGRDYWLVKNSWGLNWGDNGYVKVARSTNNFTCSFGWWGGFFPVIYGDPNALTTPPRNNSNNNLLSFLLFASLSIILIISL